MIINLPYDCDPKRIYNLNALMAQYYTRGLRILGFPTDEFSPNYPKKDVNMFHIIKIIYAIILWCSGDTAMLITNL